MSSLVVEILFAFLDEDLDNFIGGFNHHFEVILAGKSHQVVFDVFILEMIFLRDDLEGGFDVTVEAAECVGAFGVVDMDFFVVNDFEKHIFLFNFYNEFSQTVPLIGSLDD